MMIHFACGHRQPHDERVDKRPFCVTCGETRITHVDAPKPRVVFSEAVAMPLKAN